MEAQYTATPEDVIAFNQQYWKGKLPLPRWVSLCLVLLLGCAVAFQLTLLLQDSGSDLNIPQLAFLLLTFVALLAALLVLFWDRFLAYQVRRLLRDVRYARLLGPVRIHITPESIQHETATTTSTVAWQGIQKVVVTPHHLFIYHTPQSAFVVPRRAFTEESAFQEFVTTAQGYYDTAQRDRPESVSP